MLHGADDLTSTTTSASRDSVSTYGVSAAAASSDDQDVHGRDGGWGSEGRRPRRRVLDLADALARNFGSRSRTRESRRRRCACGDGTEGDRCGSHGRDAGASHGRVLSVRHRAIPSRGSGRRATLETAAHSRSSMHQGRLRRDQHRRNCDLVLAPIVARTATPRGGTRSNSGAVRLETERGLTRVSDELVTFGKLLGCREQPPLDPL